MRHKSQKGLNHKYKPGRTGYDHKPVELIWGLREFLESLESKEFLVKLRDYWFILTHRDRRRNAKITDDSWTENDRRRRTEEEETPQKERNQWSMSTDGEEMTRRGNEVPAEKNRWHGGERSRRKMIRGGEKSEQRRRFFFFKKFIILFMTVGSKHPIGPVLVNGPFLFPRRSSRSPARYAEASQTRSSEWTFAGDDWEGI